MASYIVIFGAAVRPDGSPSGSLLRRCENAVAGARALSEPRFVPSGGIGRHGRAEAVIARELLLAAGVPPERVLVEDRARDTLDSVRRCTRLLRARGDAHEVLVCTSGYHAPRCTLLFRLAGWRCSALPAASERAELGGAKWLRYVLKEGLATPWDAAWLLFDRATGRL